MPGIVAERASEQVTVLRAARLERGWSLRQLIERLWAESDRQGVRIGTHPCSVQALVISWELGRRAPQEKYRSLLVAVYGKTVEELGLPAAKAPVSLDSEVLEHLFREYREFVFWWFQRRVNDWTLAEDLTSETFIDAGLALDRLGEGLDNPYRWLAMRARWTLGDYYQQQRLSRERPFCVDEEGRTQDWPADDDLSRPEETVTSAMNVTDLLGCLSPLERDVVVMRLFDGLPMTTILKRLGLTNHAAYAAWNRAMATMRARATQPITWTIPGTAKPMVVAA